MGWQAVSAGTAGAVALVYWFHQAYQSKLYTTLVALPLWFGVLGLIYGVQQVFAVRRARAQLAEAKLHIRIRNLTKIYGAPGRFAREWNKQQRRWQRLAAAGQLPWDRENLRESATWMAALGALLIYLHTFFSSGFWLTVLSLLTLAWLFGVRELYYRWRFVNGRPPRRSQRSWRKRFRRKPRGRHRSARWQRGKSHDSRLPAGRRRLAGRALAGVSAVARAGAGAHHDCRGDRAVAVSALPPQPQDCRGSHQSGIARRPAGCASSSG